MCCKRYHIIFSTFSLKFKCKICVQKEVIHNFKNHILVTWPATNFLAGLKNQITIILFKIWPTNRFSKAKSYNFHFHKNDVTWPLSANGLYPAISNLCKSRQKRINNSDHFILLCFCCFSFGMGGIIQWFEQKIVPQFSLKVHYWVLKKCSNVWIYSQTLYSQIFFD